MHVFGQDWNQLWAKRLRSFVPRPSHRPVFDCLQYANGEGGHFIMWMMSVPHLKSKLVVSAPSAGVSNIREAKKNIPLLVQNEERVCKKLHSFNQGPTPLSVYLGRQNVIHMIKWTRPSPSVSAYCKRSKTGQTIKNWIKNFYNFHITDLCSFCCSSNEILAKWYNVV